MSLHEKSIRALADTKYLGHSLSPAAGSQACPQDDHVHSNLDRSPEKGVLRLDDETAIFLVNLGALSPDEVNSFFSNPFVEFLISLSKSVDVDIEFINLSPGLLLRQVGLLH